MRKTAVPPHAVRIGDRSTCLTCYLTCKFFLPFLPSLRNQSYEAGSKLEHILLQRTGLTWQEVLKTDRTEWHLSDFCWVPGSLLTSETRSHPCQGPTCLSRLKCGLYKVSCSELQSKGNVSSFCNIELENHQMKPIVNTR